MYHVRKAILDDVPRIRHICSEGWRETHAGPLTTDEIEDVIAEFYNEERVRGEVLNPMGWSGWRVELDGDTVVGAGGGAFVAPESSEVYALYVDPAWRGQGAGTALLDVITDEVYRQGAREQWVSVEPGNQQGISFYEARGFVLHGERSAYGQSRGTQRMTLRFWRALNASE